MVEVTYGINSANLQLAGQTVGQARAALASLLNIAAGAQAHIDGQPVDDSRILRDGDALEFIKTASAKGN